MPHVKVNDITLKYIDEGQGEPILFLHGLGSRGEDWILQTEVFAHTYRIIAPDLRGHGESSKTVGPYSVELFASDVVALLDKLSIEKVHVVGLSLGGMVAQQLAIDYAQRVHHLTLTNTCACLITGSIVDLLKLLRRALISLVLPLERSAQYVAKGLFPHAHQAELRRIAAQRLAQNDRAAYRASIRAIRRFDARRKLDQIRSPTLIVTGDRDRTIPYRLQRDLAQGIRDTRWQVIHNSGHATPLDQPGVYNRLLQSFLQDGQI